MDDAFYGNLVNPYNSKNLWLTLKLSPKYCFRIQACGDPHLYLGEKVLQHVV